MIPAVPISTYNGTYSGCATQDQAFLLSNAEANKHFSSESLRACKTTDCAVAKQMFSNGSHLVSPNGGGWWWLRPPAYKCDNAAFVDVGGFGAEGHEGNILVRLNGKKYMVKGNRDTKSNADYRRYGFEEVHDHPIIMDGFRAPSYDALYVNCNIPYANLFGYVHHSPVAKNSCNQHYCVSAERINYAPTGLNVIKELSGGKKINRIAIYPGSTDPFTNGFVCYFVR